MRKDCSCNTTESTLERHCELQGVAWEKTSGAVGPIAAAACHITELSDVLFNLLRVNFPQLAAGEFHWWFVAVL